MKLLLQDALSNLPPECLPAGTQALQISWINTVLSRFFGEAKFANTTTRWKASTAGASFSIQYDANWQGFITLPRGMLALLASAYGNTTDAPNYNTRFSNMPINGPWHEFGNGSYGVGDQVYGNGIQDAGDGWTTFANLTEASYLRVVTAQAETNPTNILFRGLDQNGAQIYSGTGVNTINGVQLNIGASLTIQTTQQFSEAPTLVQKPVTFSPVSLYSVGVASGIVTLIAIYDPGDTSPGFRRYKLGGPLASPDRPLPFTTLHAMVKRRFVRAVSLADELIPGSLPAIEQGLYALRSDRERDPKAASQDWAAAFSILNSELSEFNGSATPRLIFERGSNLAGNAQIW